MDMKTKSILIGLASSFVAVMVIVLLFFSLADLDGSGAAEAADARTALRIAVALESVEDYK